MPNEYLPNCHNQYIEVMAEHGTVGILIFLALMVTIWSMIRTIPANNYLMLAFCTIFTVSFGVESILERQVGLTLFLFFLYFIVQDAQDAEIKTVVAP